MLEEELERLAELAKDSTIEELLSRVEINEVHDFTVRMILRTISHAIDRLHEELNLKPVP